jgi:RES domain-containing protein
VILTRLDGPAVFYRAHTPEWASQPLSGAGAASKGGRLNRPGLPALYLADSQDTAIAEYQQLSPLMPPLTLVAYHVALERVVDFRHGFDPAHWAPLWQQLTCDWRRLAFFERTEPPSWVLSDQVLDVGGQGVLFRSHRGPGHNLVIYTEMLGPNDVLAVHDPAERLPRDRASWPDDPTP